MRKKVAEDGLYFTIRSFLMGQVGVIIILVSVLVLKKIDFLQTLLLSAIAFLASLIISRSFEKVVVVW